MASSAELIGGPAFSTRRGRQCEPRVIKRFEDCVDGEAVKVALFLGVVVGIAGRVLFNGDSVGGWASVIVFVGCLIALLAIGLRDGIATRHEDRGPMIMWAAGAVAVGAWAVSGTSADGSAANRIAVAVLALAILTLIGGALGEAQKRRM